MTIDLRIVRRIFHIHLNEELNSTWRNEEPHHKIHKVTLNLLLKIFYYIFILSQVSNHKAKNIRNCYVHPHQVTSPPMIKYKIKRLKTNRKRENALKKLFQNSDIWLSKEAMSQYFQSPKSCRRCWFSIMTMFSMSWL